MKRLALLLALLAPAPANAGPLVADAGLARYALAADQGAFLDWLDPQSAAVFAAAMGGDHGYIGQYWSLIAVGAVQLRREEGDLAETLWFNPLFDAGLAARWERRGDGWVATQAVPITGEMLRGEALSLEPSRFGSSIKAGAEALAARSWQAAASADWFGADRTNAGTAALARAAAARAGLDALRATEGYDNAGIAARNLLATGDERALPPQLRGALWRMGADARLSLRPVAGYRRPDGWTMALQSPDAPMLAWLVHFATPAPGEPAAIIATQLLHLGERP